MKITDRMLEIIVTAESQYCRIGVMPTCAAVADAVGTSRQYAHHAYRAAVESGRWVRRGVSWETCAVADDERKTTDTPVDKTRVSAGEMT